MASLSGSTPGLLGGATYYDLLHSYDENRATGARVSWGDGTATALVVWETGVGIASLGGFVSRINSSATAARTLTLPDSGGTFVLGDGAGITNVVDFRSGAGMHSDKLGVDVTNATTVAAPVAGFEIGNLDASRSYHFKMVLRARSAATGTGMRMKLTGPAETESVTYHVRTATDAFFKGSAFETDILMSAFVAADTDELILIEGLLVTSGATPTSPVGLQIWSETDTVPVTLKAGSLITLTEY